MRVVQGTCRQSLVKSNVGMTDTLSGWILDSFGLRFCCIVLTVQSDIEYVNGR